MSRKGDCWDNAAVESFFASLKNEHVYAKPRYRTREEARADLFEYIEGFYNSQRRHSTLEQVSPTEFEKRFSTQCASMDCPESWGNSRVLTRRGHPRPYGGEAKDFDLALDMVEDGCRGLVTLLAR